MTREVAIEERNNKLKYLITCLKCKVSGKSCDENCPTQYNAGNTGEIIKNLEEISKILEQEPCEDAVSRTETIDAMTHWFSDMLENGKEKYSIDDVLNSLSPVTLTPKWIPCSERLPKLRERVLCQCQANIYEVLKLTVDGWYHDQNHCYMDSFVIAWMPLPEPYKAESEDKE